jgi:deoxycytidylate deaminase
MPEIIKDPKEISEIEKWVEEAEEEARRSRCLKSQVGVVIVQEGDIISRGYNKIVVTDELFVNEEGYCNPCIREDIHNNSLVERCYAIHAEQMALINAKYDLEGSTMYHVKIKDGKRVPIEIPTCTVCNRMLKEAGIYFVCLQKEGYVKYSPEEIANIQYLRR